MQSNIYLKINRHICLYNQYSDTIIGRFIAIEFALWLVSIIVAISPKYMYNM